MMSQQCNEGFLDESELPEQIHRYLDLKLDKEAFIRPTKEVVTELYTRFLNKSGYNWLRPGPGGKDPTVWARMLNALRRIFSRYSIEFEFNLSDINFPTRKRTTTFLNVILYLLAVLEERKKHFQMIEAQEAVKQQKVDQMKKEIAKMRLAMDELGLRLGQEDREQMREDNEAARRKLEKQKLACEAKEQEGAVIKAAIEQEDKRNAQQALKVHQTEGHVQVYNKVRELRQQKSELKKALDDNEIVHKQRLKQLEIEASQAERDDHKRRTEMEEFVRRERTRNKELELEIAEIISRREGRKVKWEQRENVYKELLERADKQLEMLRARAENLLGTDATIEVLLSGHKEKLDALLGESKMVQQSGTDRNSTFIKSKATN